MARPGQLANAIAEVLDLEPQTVRHRARILRDAGLMALERGGRSKGSMTPRDAAHLLLAAAGASKVKDSALPVEQHGACRSQEGAWTLSFEGLSELLELDDRHTLADALEALIQDAIRGVSKPDTLQLWVEKHEGELYPGPLAVQVSIKGPSAHATIEIGVYGRDDDGGKIVNQVCSRTYTSRPLEGEGTSFAFHGNLGDLTHIHVFTERTIFQIAQKMKGG